MAQLSKSSVVASVASVASLLTTQLQDTDQRLSALPVKSSEEKAELQAIQTKVKYFDHLAFLVNNNDKVVSALYYVVKNTKADAADLLKEIASNSYSLDKFGFMLNAVALGSYSYDIANMSACNIMAALDFIRDGKDKFTMREYRSRMAHHKENAGRKADSGFTQTSQALKLCQRLGLVEYVGGKLSLGYAEFKVNTDNELVKYLKSVFTKDKETQAELNLLIAE